MLFDEDKYLLLSRPLSVVSPGFGGGDGPDAGDEEDEEFNFDEESEDNLNLDNEEEEPIEGSDNDSDKAEIEKFLNDPANKETLGRRFGKTSLENIIRNELKNRSIGTNPSLVMRATRERSNFRTGGSTPAMDRLMGLVEKLIEKQNPGANQPTFAERLKAIRDDEELSPDEREQKRDELFLEVISNQQKLQSEGLKNVEKRTATSQEAAELRARTAERQQEHDREEAEVKKKFPHLVKTQGGLDTLWAMRDAYFNRLNYALANHPSGMGDPQSPNFNGAWAMAQWKRNYKPLPYFAENFETLRRTATRNRVDLRNNPSAQPGSSTRVKRPVDFSKIPRGANAREIIEAVDGS
jgi:hypothetical protein